MVISQCGCLRPEAPSSLHLFLQTIQFPNAPGQPVVVTFPKDMKFGNSTGPESVPHHHAAVGRGMGRGAGVGQEAMASTSAGGIQIPGRRPDGGPVDVAGLPGEVISVDLAPCSSSVPCKPLELPTVLAWAESPARSDQQPAAPQERSAM